jgi:putative sulfotransferase
MSELERCLILSSGRCGSTLLSELIATEPETLSVQESLVNRELDYWASDAKMAGSEYWSLLSSPGLQWEAAVRIGAITGEFRYPATDRWGGNLAALPPIAAVTLPAISADPDSLFDLLEARVPGFPAQTLAQHHVMFLDFLASLQQRRRWVERSGGSSSLAAALLGKISFEKVVYLTRELAATASSMSRHSEFQFSIIRAELLFRCGFDPYREFARRRARDGAAHAGGAQTSDGQVPAGMQCLLPEQITVETLTERGGGVEHHKLAWVGMSYAAEAALTRYPPRQLLRMRYEDLVAAPEEQLTRLAEFLGFADPAGWAARSADQVRQPRRPAPAGQPAVRASQGRSG